MASNKAVWIGNAYGATEPLVMLGKFETGTAIKRGEMLEHTADTNSSFTPLASDLNCSANFAIAAEEVKSADRMGFYEVYIPRPGDIWRFPLAAAAATAVGASMTWSDSQTLTTGGSYAVGYAVGQEHYPLKQGHLTDDAGPDHGETIKSSAYVDIMVREAASYYSLFAK